MRFSNYITIFFSVFSAFASGAGCVPRTDESQMIPHVDGKWIGRIESIKLYDVEGEVFDGAILHIAGGPELPHPVPQNIGGGKAPILCEYTESNFRIIPASRLPVDKMIQIEGLMVVNYALAAYRT